MTSFLYKFFNGKWAHAFVIITYSYFCLIIMIEVIRRYVFGDSSAWGEMTARYAFVYMTYIAVAESVRQKKHIRVDLIDRLVSVKKLKWIKIYSDFLTVVISVLVIYYSIELMKLQIMVGIVMTAADINMAFAQAALPLGWGLILIRLAQNWFDDANEIKSLI